MSKEKVYEIDDSIVTDTIDELLVNMDISVLEQVRDENNKEIIDKAINEKNRRNALMEKEERENRRIGLNMFLSELFGVRRSPKIDDEDNDYEPYNFEEEELEDDDYYHDDLD
jgi:hypothetical protein